jgi:hypothetical protein
MKLLLVRSKQERDTQHRDVTCTQHHDIHPTLQYKYRHYTKATKCPLEVIDIRDNNVGLSRVVEAMEQAVHKKT